MLIIDEDGDMKREFDLWVQASLGTTEEIDTFRAGWQAGRSWERAFHTAAAREQCGIHGEHGGDDHPAGHTH